MASYFRACVRACVNVCFHIFAWEDRTIWINGDIWWAFCSIKRTSFANALNVVRVGIRTVVFFLPQTIILNRSNLDSEIRRDLT